jgi:hypothetical protein
MGMPVLPDVSQEQALTDLLESIALEEAALAALINAEAEKVQAVAAKMEQQRHHGRLDLDEVIDFQKAVAGVVQTAIKMQMLLQFKLENVLDAKLELETHGKGKKREAGYETD